MDSWTGVDRPNFEKAFTFCDSNLENGDPNDLDLLDHDDDDHGDDEIEPMLLFSTPLASMPE